MLKNKLAIITGAGNGLGRTLSLAFCNQGGAKVVSSGRNLAPLK